MLTLDRWWDVSFVQKGGEKALETFSQLNDWTSNSDPVVKYFSDRIGVMYYGHMVELAPSDELFMNPLHPYTRSLLSAIPLPDPKYEKARKRIVYNPLADHDYSEEKPTLREIKPGHFVSCNTKEFEKYQKILK